MRNLLTYVQVHQDILYSPSSWNKCRQVTKTINTLVWMYM